MLFWKGDASARGLVWPMTPMFPVLLSCIDSSPTVTSGLVSEFHIWSDDQILLQNLFALVSAGAWILMRERNTLLWTVKTAMLSAVWESFLFLIFTREIFYFCCNELTSVRVCVCKEEEKKKEKKKKFFCVDREREREREHVDTHENCKKKTHCSPKKEKLKDKTLHSSPRKM